MTDVKKLIPDVEISLQYATDSNFTGKKTYPIIRKKEVNITVALL